MTGTLVVGVSMRQDMGLERVTGELAQELPTREHGTGVNEHVANDIDVEIVERQQRETKDIRSDPTERHGR